jgi:hypothetical protein
MTLELLSYPLGRRVNWTNTAFRLRTADTLEVDKQHADTYDSSVRVQADLESEMALLYSENRRLRTAERRNNAKQASRCLTNW